MKKFYYLFFMLLLSWSSVNLCQAQTLIRQDGNVYIEDSDGEVWRVDTTSLIVYVDTQETIDITNLSEIPLDLSSLKNGYYFVKVYVDGENVLNKKVFKVR